MSRLIDADALRRWIEGECKSPSIPRNEAAFGKRILMHMEVIESEEAQTIEPERKTGKWVSCSERLPEENMWTICQNNAGAMMIGKYDIEFGWMFPAYFDATVAWMPLPKPWGGEEHE